MSTGSSTPAAGAVLTGLPLPDVFRMMMVRGAVAVVFGVLALAWPAVTALVLALLFGAYALVNGVSAIITAIRDDGLFHRWLVALSGALNVIAGGLTLFWPGITVLALTFVVGAWALATGISEIVTAVRLRRVVRHKGFLVIAGVLSVIAGVLLVWHPLAGALGIAVVVGTYAVLYGLLLIGLGAWLRHVVRHPATT
ncbi:HdeD family acid-resistance protein [Amycolatopsis sp. NPDC004378]